MQPAILSILRCPVTRLELTLQVIQQNSETGEIEEGILFGKDDWMYPVTGGIPRLTVEAFLDYEKFLGQHLADFAGRKARLMEKHQDLLTGIIKKNKRTKESFSKEWSVYDYDRDKTFLADDEAMMERFLAETGVGKSALKGRLILDAGCGNGKLDTMIADAGATVIAMDFSNSVEQAALHNTNPNAHYIQADVQFPPFAAHTFDIVHCSGVLIHTNNTEASFAVIDPLVKPGGLMSTWLYHPRKNFIHNLFNRVRKVTSKLPLSFQYYAYSFTLLPVSYVVKKAKGSRQNRREMMVDILDWFSPEFRWEHTHEEAAGWFAKRDYKDIKITTTNTFGFNITGVKKTDL